MSIVPKEMIEVIAQSIGINNLSPHAALALAPDVEYRMREIIQEAVKCMRHSRRTILTTDDVDGVLSFKNVEPIYGFASGGPLRFKRAIGRKKLFYIDDKDKDIDLKDVIEAPLPKAPLDTCITYHWLAIDGIQPSIPENAAVEAFPVPEARRSENKDDGVPADVRIPLRHVISRELQVSRGLGDIHLLFALMRLITSLLRNPHILVEPYLHQLMPSVVTCLVARRLGNRFADNHWELRDFAAQLVSSVCKRYGHVYINLQPCLTKTLINAFLDPKRAITQHYGAIQGLAALGSNVVCLHILPNLEPYMRLLEPQMLVENQKNEMKRHEAWTMYGALLRAAGQCIYGRLKMFPTLPSDQATAVCRSKEKIVATMSGKRKAGIVHSEIQPPLKRLATDGPMDVVANSSQPEAEMKIFDTTLAVKSLDASLSPPNLKTKRGSSSRSSHAYKSYCDL